MYSWRQSLGFRVWGLGFSGMLYNQKALKVTYAAPESEFRGFPSNLGKRKVYPCLLARFDKEDPKAEARLLRRPT